MLWIAVVLLNVFMSIAYAIFAEVEPKWRGILPAVTLSIAALPFVVGGVLQWLVLSASAVSALIYVVYFKYLYV